MYDPTEQQRVRETIAEREGDPAPHLSPGAQPPDDETAQRAFDAAWHAWLDLTADLQGLGIAPAAMCDTVNRVAETRTELGASTAATTA